ncbi:hypothetical protein AMTR_s00016p00052620 [Amborella trichopoda]|uniref:Neprosin PEP catalytic domain-containing protein n=1 Tax=Amborella trichopoda TaxID=13333 RepID=W1PEP2_AMBTC|nr:hypothetical protein AMTR_s00016p00052620 [Amborella trichopoda]
MFASKKDFYGAIQAVSAWTPQVEVPTEFSAASTWLVNNEGTETNVVGAGWMVNPSLFGDNLTRLFVSWNKVGSQTTGCYNLFCSGFIQTDKNVVLGAYLKPITVPGGTEYFLHYNIIKPLFGTIMNRSRVKYLRTTLHLRCPSIEISSGCPMVYAIAFKAYVLRSVCRDSPRHATWLLAKVSYSAKSRGPKGLNKFKI